MQISIIAAIEKNNGIGLNNDLPWHYPEDLKLFKCLTYDHCLIMGRKTMDSLKRPLPRRDNFVISRQTSLSYNGNYKTFDCIELAVHEAKKAKHSHAFIIGGASIFHAALNLTDKIYLTKIDKKYACDVFFPKIPKRFILENRQQLSESLAFETYTKQGF